MDFDRVSLQSGVRLFERPGSDIRLTGYLKKMKTMKKKFFVLRSTSSSGPARLEYYDSEKKFNAAQRPKREIHLHTCFNINRKSDSRHKHAIALYTKEECFSVLCDDEKDQEHWLALMLEYQDEYIRDDETTRQHYEFVWQVTLQPKDLGQTLAIRGPYRLCLTRFNICLVKLNMEKPQYVFQLETVRSLAHNDNLFRMEVGKIAPTGEGELWMQADDADTAQNLHETILNFMKNMDRRFDLHDNRRSENVHGSTATLTRQSEFRQRTASESFSLGSCRNRTKIEQRPMSVCAHTARSTSHLHNTISPGTSPLTHVFDHPIMGSHRLRSDSNDSKASRSSMSTVNDDSLHDLHPHLMGPVSDIMPLEEEPDFDHSFSADQRSLPSSPGSHLVDHDDYDGQEVGYMEMHPGSVTPPTPGNSGYMDMAPVGHRDVRESLGDQGGSYVPMNPAWPQSAPIPIHGGHSDGPGYMEMASHNPLPPVKEGGSTEGYLPMSPSYSASPSGSSSSHLRPDRVVCMLSDDSADFAQPPTRTYSLGSRPVKAGSGGVKVGAAGSAYVDMSGKRGVSDNGRSCSAPHLIGHHHHHQSHHHPASRAGRGGGGNSVDSPTPSASPLSVSLKSDDSDSFMELDFYRPRTASDSYSYRPRASSFGMQQSSLAQGHRPRSSSHGQGTRPLRRKMLGVMESSSRLGHDIMHRSSQNSSHGSFDSLKVSSSESLRKLSQEVRAKTAQLHCADYVDMSSADRRHTPSPQPGSSVGSSRSGQNGYVDMTVSQRKASPTCSKLSSRSNSKTSSSERLQESEYTQMSLGGGGGGAMDSVYVNYDSHDSGSKKDSSSRSSSLENVDTYMPYEPAVATASSMKSSSSKGEVTAADPRSRSGSGGKEQKKRGFFSMRSHGDSGKHGAKKVESSPQPSSVISYSSTGGDKFGSLGRNIRQKSKDSAEKSVGRKSSSFSRTFGITATKPGKRLTKTPTPPKSLDGNDEYIEFSPMAVKSDSDSSHSSGSTRTSRCRQERVFAKEEAEYVGFEPGNIAPSSSAPTSGGYLPMTGGGGGVSGSPAGGQVFKPVMKSGAKWSKSKDDGVSGSVAPAASPQSSQDQPLAKPVAMYPLRQSSAPAPATSSLSPQCEFKELAKLPSPSPPLPIIPGPGSVPSPSSDPLSSSSLSSPSSSLLPSASAPTTSQSLTPGLCPLPSPSPPPPLSTLTTTSTPAAVMSSAGPAPGVTPVPPTMPALPSFSPASTPSPLSYAAVTKGPPLPCLESGYMDFDPSVPASSAVETASSSSSSFSSAAIAAKLEVVPSYIRDDTATRPDPSAAKPVASADRWCPSSDATSATTPAPEPGSCKSEAREKVSSSMRSGSGQPGWEGPSGSQSGSSLSTQSPNNRSGGNSSRGGNSAGKAGNGGSSMSSSGSHGDPGGAAQEAKTGDADGSAAPKGKDAQDPCPPSQSSQSSPGLTRPDSTPCMLSMDKPSTMSSTPRGRGRHCSSSSVGAGQHKKGKSSTGSDGGVRDGSNGGGGKTAGVGGGSGGGSGMLLINTEAAAWHSITDLSGYEKMSFPSNALSRQQPAHFSNRQYHPPNNTTTTTTTTTTGGGGNNPGPSPSASSSQGGTGSGSISGSEAVLNYATLDLGSDNSVGEPGDSTRSPRNKSRHSSAAGGEEKGEPLSYATIDFEKSENLRLLAAKDKRSL